MFHRFDQSLRIEGEEGSSGERFGGYKLNAGPFFPLPSSRAHLNFQFLQK
jgi:hypothetical protein